MTTRDEITIGQADFPKPFYNGLEFNPPVHGTWNIVHIGLQMPEAVQIYVCAKNCMRGVILTAAEMGMSDRFSYVILEEKDTIQESIDQITYEGVVDVIEKRLDKGMPTRAVQLFTVCTHHFLGCDYKKLYARLEEHFPQIDFYACYMDPIMQKQGLTPDQKLRRAMFSHLSEGKVNVNRIALLGSDFLLDPESELARLIKGNGFELVETKSCQTYEEFLSMGQAGLFLCTYPNAKAGVETLAKRLNRPYLYLPATFDELEIQRQLDILLEELKKLKPEAKMINVETNYNDEVSIFKRKLGKQKVVLDGVVHPKPLSLAVLLLRNSIEVSKIYTDVLSPEEEISYKWLADNHPELLLSATIHVAKRRRDCEISNGLAVGPKAAYFESQPYFVNMVAGFGLWGYEGIRKMLKEMTKALEEPKDLEDILPRKGLGCDSCLL